MIHTWHEPTGYCTRCGILNMNCQRPLECLATPNCHGMMHLLAKRRMEQGKIIGEAFPKEPT